MLYYSIVSSNINRENVAAPRGYLQKKDKAAAAVGVLSTPGSGSFPWEKQEPWGAPGG